MKFILGLLFFATSLFSTSALAQSDAEKAQIQVHVINATSALQNSNWDQALRNVNRAQDLLGSSAAIFESIRVKAYHGKKDYQRAKEHLLIFFQLSPANNLIEEIAPISLEIDNKLEEIEERRRLALEAEKRAEEERRALERRKAEIAKEIESEIESTLIKFEQIEEGFPYYVTYRKPLTSNNNEKAVLITYGDKYIAYTVPNLELVKLLFKDRVTYNSSMPTGINVAEIRSSSSRSDVRFQGSKKYSNVFFGGFSDDLLWTSGEQNTIFEQKVYYYFESNDNGTNPKLWMDVTIPESFEANILNPYIETGTIEKTVDFELIQNEDHNNRLRNLRFKNKRSSNLDNPESAKVTLNTLENGITILYPTKDITYQFLEKVIGVNNSNNTKYTGNYLHFTPQTISTHYGFMRVGISYPEYDLISGIDYSNKVSDYKINEATFDSFYNSINNPELKVGEKRFYTSTGYTAIFEIIPSLFGE